MKDKKKKKPEQPVGEEAAAEATGSVQPEAAEAVAEVEAEAAPEAPPEPTVEERLAAERDELKEKWLRTLAELDNLRKRSRREVQDARRFAQAEVLRPVLEVADNFERALQAMDGSEDQTAAGVREGVAMIQQRVLALLREQGVEAIEAAGAEFDPAVHEAVAQVPSGEHAAGTVIDVVQKGYRFGEMVLRPARVVIAS